MDNRYIVSIGNLETYYTDEIDHIYFGSIITFLYEKTYLYYKEYPSKNNDVLPPESYIACLIYDRTNSFAHHVIFKVTEKEDTILVKYRKEKASYSVI